MELILYKEPKEYIQQIYLTKLLEKICSGKQFTGNVKLPLPQEIIDMIYGFTDFFTAINHNCSDYILDKFYNTNECVRYNINKKSLNYNHHQSHICDEYSLCSCFSENPNYYVKNCCFNKDLSDNTKFKIFKYSIKKNKKTLNDISFEYKVNLYDFIIHNRVFIKAFNITDYDFIKQKFNEIKIKSSNTYALNCNVLRIMSGMAGLSYSN